MASPELHSGAKHVFSLYFYSFSPMFAIIISVVSLFVSGLYQPPNLLAQSDNNMMTRIDPTSTQRHVASL
jgi:hypothetical protein